ncbi:MAG: amidohydrolase family protein [Isosphaeraceae bacterium]|nr:amidohydrolase family protein [Isosphaeraceae bacterium]
MNPSRPRFALSIALLLSAASGELAPGAEPALVLRPDRVFLGGGEPLETGWVVVVRGDKIQALGPPAEVEIPPDARSIELPGATLLPGLIDAHTHVMLHPYDETSWEDQVLREPLALRTARAVNHLKATLDSGFTTIRDLGTEGAGYADVGLRAAVERGIVPGPRLLATTRAIVATGSYAPNGFAPELAIPQGAEEADGVDPLIRVVRDQIGKGADWIKVYADAAMGGREVRPSFTLAELRTIVETANANGVKVAAHAVSREGMRRAALAKVSTIEHGDEGDAEVFRIMAENGVAYCPTLAAAEAMSRYAGWKPGDPEPERLARVKQAVVAARKAGVVIANGSDMGVFAHGQGVRELELLAETGIAPAEVLEIATTRTARVLGLDTTLGRLAPTLKADLIAVEGDPTRDLKSLRKIRLVVKNGVIATGG